MKLSAKQIAALRRAAERKSGVLSIFCPETTRKALVAKGLIDPDTNRITTAGRAALQESAP